MKKKKYKVLIISGSENLSRTVEADRLRCDADGFYVFENHVENKENFTCFDQIAYYPINRTVIELIEE